jgi:hypothetical protein
MKQFPKPSYSLWSGLLLHSDFHTITVKAGNLHTAVFPPAFHADRYTFKDSEEKGERVYISLQPYGRLSACDDNIAVPLNNRLFDNIRHPENIRPVIEHGVYMGLVLLAGSIAGVMTGKKQSNSGFGMTGLHYCLPVFFSRIMDSTQSTKAILKTCPQTQDSAHIQNTTRARRSMQRGLYIWSERWTN